MDEPGEVRIDYTNWRGVRRIRRVVPVKFEFGSNEWHPEPQWLMEARDLDIEEEGVNSLRTFALKGIHQWGAP